MVVMSGIDKALDAYGKACELLWEKVHANPDEFHSGAVTSGTIAEYFVKNILKRNIVTIQLFLVVLLLKSHGTLKYAKNTKKIFYFKSSQQVDTAKAENCHL